MRHDLLRTIPLCIALISLASFAAAQEAGGDRTRQQTAPSSSTSRTSADEEFDLNITEQRITRRDFQASTSVEIGGQQKSGLNLRVGVGVAASEIDVLLRNVYGHVRFRASFEPMLQRLQQLRNRLSSSP